MGCTTGPKSMIGSTEQHEERKTTLKMKPHWVQKPFQEAAGHNIKIVTIFNHYIQQTSRPTVCIKIIKAVGLYNIQQYKSYDLAYICSTKTAGTKYHNL